MLSYRSHFVLVLLLLLNSLLFANQPQPAYAQAIPEGVPAAAANITPELMLNPTCHGAIAIHEHA